MSNGYNFYIQKYPVNATSLPVVDIEQTFTCRYCYAKNIQEYGKIKNVYTESFAESSKQKIYIPPEDELAYESTTVELSVAFVGANCIDNSDTFYEYVRGQLLEFHDTFRWRYVTLLLTEAPTIVAEKLYKGAQSYRQMSYKFTNVYGRPFERTQIEEALDTYTLLSEDGGSIMLESGRGSITLEEN